MMKCRRSLELHTIGNDIGQPLLYVHGFGGLLEDPGLMEMLRGLSDGGFAVTCALLPTTFDEIMGDVVHPLSDHIGQNGTGSVIGFSLGGLVSSFFMDMDVRIFVSPLWGVGRSIEPVGLKGAFAAVSRNARTRLVRTDGVTKLDIEPTEEGLLLMEGLDKAAPSIMDAMAGMPPPLENDLVVWSERDHLISPEAILSRKVKEVRLVGGHMLFSGAARKKLLETSLSHLRHHGERSGQTNGPSIAIQEDIGPLEQR